MLRVGIVGGTGKLGKQVIESITDSERLQIGAVVTRKGNQHVGMDVGTMAGIGEMGIPVVADLQATSCDVYVDCTNQDGFRNNYQSYSQLQQPLIIATTGFDTQTEARISTLAHTCPVLLCPNFSPGVYKFLRIVSNAAKELSDIDADIQIIESHHKTKKDKPSGTALRIVQNIEEQKPQGTGSIEVHSIRAGDIIGEHTLMFVTNDGERIELSHRVYSRKGFAKGVIQAVEWIADKDKGLYDINDLFGGT